MLVGPVSILKIDRGIQANWVVEIVNASLKDSCVFELLNEAVVRPLFKKLQLDPSFLGIRQPPNFLF